MESIASKAHVEESINWKHIASLCDNFSGADLQALIYTANVFAARELMEEATALQRQAQNNANSLDSWINKIQIVQLKEELVKVHLLPEEFDNLRDRLQNLVRNLLVQGSYSNARVPLLLKKDQANESKVIIKQHNLEAALRQSKSSLGEKELAEFDYIYSAFNDNRTSSNNEHMDRAKMKQKRVTMA